MLTSPTPFFIFSWTTTCDLLRILAPFTHDDDLLEVMVREINRQGQITIGPDFRLWFLRHYRARHLRDRLRYRKGHRQPSRGIGPAARQALSA